PHLRAHTTLGPRAFLCPSSPQEKAPPPRKAGMHAPECGDRRIYACQLHADEAIEQHAAAGAAVTLVTHAADSQRCELWNDLKRKFIARPIIIDDRRDLALHKIPHPFDDGAFTLVEQVGNPVKVSVGRWRRIVELSRQRCLLTHRSPP